MSVDKVSALAQTVVTIQIPLIFGAKSESGTLQIVFHTDTYAVEMQINKENPYFFNSNTGFSLRVEKNLQFILLLLWHECSEALWKDRNKNLNN